jgi:hypothetical protein
VIRLSYIDQQSDPSIVDKAACPDDVLIQMLRFLNFKLIITEILTYTIENCKAFTQNRTGS